MGNVFTRATMLSRIAQMERVLTPHRKNQQRERFPMGICGGRNGINAAVDRRVFAICPIVEQRIVSVRAQLAGEHA